MLEANCRTTTSTFSSSSTAAPQVHRSLQRVCIVEFFSDDNLFEEMFDMDEYENDSGQDFMPTQSVPSASIESSNPNSLDQLENGQAGILNDDLNRLGGDTVAAGGVDNIEDASGSSSNQVNQSGTGSSPAPLPEIAFYCGPGHPLPVHSPENAATTSSPTNEFNPSGSIAQTPTPAPRISREIKNLPSVPEIPESLIKNAVNDRLSPPDTAAPSTQAGPVGGICGTTHKPEVYRALAAAKTSSSTNAFALAGQDTATTTPKSRPMPQTASLPPVLPSQILRSTSANTNVINVGPPHPPTQVAPQIPRSVEQAELQRYMEANGFLPASNSQHLNAQLPNGMPGTMMGRQHQLAPQSHNGVMPTYPNPNYNYGNNFTGGANPARPPFPGVSRLLPTQYQDFNPNTPQQARPEAQHQHGISPITYQMFSHSMNSGSAGYGGSPLGTQVPHGTFPDGQRYAIGIVPSTPGYGPKQAPRPLVSGGMNSTTQIGSNSLTAQAQQSAHRIPQLPSRDHLHLRQHKVSLFSQHEHRALHAINMLTPRLLIAPTASWTPEQKIDAILRWNSMYGTSHMRLSNLKDLMNICGFRARFKGFAAAERELTKSEILVPAPQGKDGDAAAMVQCLAVLDVCKENGWAVHVKMEVPTTQGVGNGKTMVNGKSNGNGNGKGKGKATDLIDSD